MSLERRTDSLGEILNIGFDKLLKFENFLLKFVESVRWPAGSYGIPEPASGCPRAVGIQWQNGWRFQYTGSRVRHSNSSRSPEFHLNARVTVFRVFRSFCIKTSTVDDDNRPVWPPGNTPHFVLRIQLLRKKCLSV